MKRTRILLAGLALATVSGAAAAFDLSNCDGSGLDCPYVTYGDGNSYALALNAYMWDYYMGGGTGPSNPFYVPSTPGAIKSLIVNATGSSGQDVTTNFTGMDNAYPTPTGVNGSTFFSTVLTADPGGTGEFTGDLATSWDTTVAALTDFLGTGNTPIFFFNNNQTNSGSQIDQDLAIWAQITLTDSTGANTALVFDFTNNGGTFTEPGGGVFNGDPTAYTSDGSGPLAGTNAATDYVLSGGLICVGDPVAPSLYPTFIPALADGTCPAGTNAINSNLGANQAAYAVVFPELNAALLTGLYDSMHIDLRMGCDPNTIDPAVNCVGRDLNNGYEQLFIAAAAGVPTVPEPATLALLGLGLMGLGLARRKGRPAV